MADKRLLENGTDKRLTEAGDFRLLEDVPPLLGTATLSLTTNGNLTVPPDILDGAATLALTTAGALTVPKLLAGAAVLALEAAGALGLHQFMHMLVIAPRINGGAFRFLHQVRIIQADLPEFTHSLTIHRELQEFAHRLRILPDVETLFEDDIQRPVGRVEQA
jgi:hypothetical protein